MAANIIVRIQDTTEKLMEGLDAYLLGKLPQATTKWYYINPSTNVVMVDIRAKEGDNLDRQFFSRSATKSQLKLRHITSFTKINAQTAQSELHKFLTIPGVHSVFADAQAENFLAGLKEDYKPRDHGKKTEVDLFTELKNEFIHNAEKAGMSLKAFYNAKVEDEKARHLLIDRKKKFEELEEGCRYFTEDHDVKFSLGETLDSYLLDNPLREVTGEECVKMISEAGHYNILKAVHDIFFKREDKKKRLVWLHGPRNTGKSSFIGLMEDIFATRQFNFKQAYCTMDPPPEDKSWAVQIYTSHEFDVKNAFTQDHFANLKTIFEGKGGYVSNNKHIKFKRQMIDGLFLVASNELPMCADSILNHTLYKTEWEPFTSRCAIVEMGEDEERDGNIAFPYTARVLAGALKHLTAEYKPLTESDQLQEEEKSEEVKQEESHS